MPRDLHNPNFQPVVGRTWCFLHHAWEKIHENNYRVCGECGHSYFTARAVLYAHNELMAEMYEQHPEWYDRAPTKEDDAEKILSCPACGHDW